MPVKQRFLIYNSLTFELPPIQNVLTASAGNISIFYLLITVHFTVLLLIRSATQIVCTYAHLKTKY